MDTPADARLGETDIMAEDWAIDVKKYAPDADYGVIAAIVDYCGIALRSRDSSLIAFSDSGETDLIRENYLKQKLGLVDADSDLDAAIAAVGTQLQGDRTRNRVTVYYLLAQAFGKLGVFGAGAAAAAPVPVMAVETAAPVVTPVAAAPLGVAAGSGFAEYLPLLLLVLGGAALLWYLTQKAPAPVAPAANVAVAAPAVVVPGAVVPAMAPPAGADVVETMVEGEPMVSVYFDTAKSDIDPKFEAITGPIRTYLTDHAGDHLQISGYNDPRGDAAMNAELSKNRAFAVRDALARLGVTITSIALVKPADTTEDGDKLAQARRVDVTVEDGPVPAADVEPAAQ